jgi:hypothetical protein
MHRDTDRDLTTTTMSVTFRPFVVDLSPVSLSLSLRPSGVSRRFSLFFRPLFLVASPRRACPRSEITNYQPPIARGLNGRSTHVGPCAFTCIQGAPLVVIKLSRMTDLPARLSASPYAIRPCERPVLADTIHAYRSLENSIALSRDRLPLRDRTFEEPPFDCDLRFLRYRERDFSYCASPRPTS